MASKNNDIKEFQLLLSLGANIKSKNIKFLKLIILILINIIWYKKRKFNAKNKSLLHIAVENNAFEIFKILILLLKGENINEIDIIYLKIILSIMNKIILNW